MLMSVSTWFSKAPLWIKVQPEVLGVLVAVAGGTLVRVGVRVGRAVADGVEVFVFVFVDINVGGMNEVWLGVGERTVAV